MTVEMVGPGAPSKQVGAARREDDDIGSIDAIEVHANEVGAAGADPEAVGGV